MSDEPKKSKATRIAIAGISSLIVTLTSVLVIKLAGSRDPKAPRLEPLGGSPTMQIIPIHSEMPAKLSLFRKERQAIQKAAYDLATNEILKQIPAPASAKFQPFTESHIDYGSSNAYSVAGMFDAQNTAGALLRWSYYADIKFNPDRKIFIFDKLLIWEGRLD